MRLLQWMVLFAALIFTSQASAVNFKFKDINGKYHKLSDYKGQWVFVNYWGTRCAPCRAEVPALNKIVRKYRGKAKVIGIELMSSTDRDIRSFMSANGMRFTVAGTQRSVINPLGRIRRLPTTFIISPQGTLVKTHAGVLSEQQVRPYMNQKKEVAKKQNKPAVKYKAPQQAQAVVQAQPKKEAVKVVAPKQTVAKKKKPAASPSKAKSTHDMLMSINPDDFF